MQVLRDMQCTSMAFTVPQGLARRASSSSGTWACSFSPRLGQLASFFLSCVEFGRLDRGRVNTRCLFDLCELAPRSEMGSVIEHVRCRRA